MSNYSFNHISTSTDRYKIYTLLCNPSELKDKIELVKAQNIPVINLGKELAEYIDRLDDYSYLNPHCASTRGNACIHKAVGLSEFLFVYYRFYFGEGSLLDAKGVKQLL